VGFILNADDAMLRAFSEIIVIAGRHEQIALQAQHGGAKKELVLVGFANHLESSPRNSASSANRSAIF
jgi:hypothetical protein